MTVWRELRKLNTDELESQLPDNIESSNNLSAIHKATDEGNYELFIKLMGGAIVARKSLPLRAYYFIKDEVNKYGKEIQKLTGLITFQGKKLVTRLRCWKVGLTKREPETKACGVVYRTGPPSGPLEFCQ